MSRERGEYVSFVLVLALELEQERLVGLQVEAGAGFEVEVPLATHLVSGSVYSRGDWATRALPERDSGPPAHELVEFSFCSAVLARPSVANRTRGVG
jgi:hypothetical protein